MIEENKWWSSSKKKLFTIFLVAFLVSFFLQGIQWREFGLADSSSWGHEAEYVLQGDPREFNFLAAYGHPGGPIIEGTIILHKLFNLPYDDQALLVFLTLINSFSIAGVCVLCYVLRKNNFWWIAVLGILSFNRLYEYATPPTVISAVLVVFLCLLTLYLYEKKEQSRTLALALFGFIAGLSIATRADIGVFSFLVFLALIWHIFPWRKIGLLVGGTFLSFVAFDPFMWFMPVQHIKDLIFKIVYHYAEFAQNHMTFVSVLGISFLAFISIFLSIQFLLFRKKLASPLPPMFVCGLWMMTVALYIIFLTSRIQTPRYFLPIIFIWETFLPLFIFTLIEKIQLTFLKTLSSQEKGRTILKIFIVALLYLYHLSFFMLSFWLYSVFRLLP